MKLWFAPEHESRVREEFEPEQIKPLPSGGFLVQAPLPADDWLAGYLLSFGGGLRALDPPCLELRMRQKAERILADFCDSDIQLSAERAYDKGNKGDKRQKGE